MTRIEYLSQFVQETDDHGGGIGRFAIRLDNDDLWVRIPIPGLYDPKKYFSGKMETYRKAVSVLQKYFPEIKSYKGAGSSFDRDHFAVFQAPVSQEEFAQIERELNNVRSVNKVPDLNDDIGRMLLKILQMPK